MILESFARRMTLRRLPKELVLPRHVVLGKSGCKHEEDTAGQNLISVVEAFRRGLVKSISCRDIPTLHAELISEHARQYRGFAFEGASMGLGILLRMLPWRKSLLSNFMQGVGQSYIHLIHVGLGWAMGHRKEPPSKLDHRLDPLLRWLAIDGLGFCHGILSPDPETRALVQQRGYAARGLRQGYGRALWFLCRSKTSAIDRAIGNLSADWHADLWSGVGLASVYAGRASPDELDQLRIASGRYHPALAQGAAFAAKARQLAGDLDEAEDGRYYEDACQILCQRGAREAALLTDDALNDLPKPGAIPAYEHWRQRIQSVFSDTSIRGSSAMATSRVYHPEDGQFDFTPSSSV